MQYVQPFTTSFGDLSATLRANRERALAACRTESFHILGIVENGRFRLPWRFDLAALAPVDPATGLYL